MSLVRADSFGHYSTILQKWDSVGDNSINFNAAIARTNTGYLQVNSGSFGPAKLLPAQYPQLIAHVAFNLDTPAVGQQVTVFQFQVAGVGYNLAVRVNGDSSFSVWRGNPSDGGSVELFRTSYRPMVWNTWNSVVCTATFSDTNGSVVLKVNGRMVGSISGVRTTAQLGSAFCDGFQLFGAPSNGALSFLGDFVLLDPTVSPNATALDSPKVYVTVPTANGTPVNWTPLSGQNFANVNEIPPDGDTSYVSSSTVNQVDQYQHPLTAIPGTAVIAASQHCLDMRIDSGARTVASDLAGDIGAGSALTTSYLIYCTQRDSDPSPSPVSAGPKVTA